MEAIDYAKKQLTKFDDDPDTLSVLSKILGFIAFNQDRRPQNFNYKVCLSLSRMNLSIVLC